MSENSASKFGSFSAIVWFVVLFAAAMSVATLTLSASQLQSRLAALSKTNTTLTVWQVERIRKQLNDKTSKVAELTESTDELLDSLEATMAENNEAVTRRDEADQNYQQHASRLAAKLENFNPLETPDAPLDLPEAQLEATFEKIIDALKGKLEAENQAEVNELFELLVTASNTKLEMANRVNVLSGHVQDADHKYRQKVIQRDVEESGIERIIDPTNTMQQTVKDTLNDLILEFNFIEQFARGVLYKFSVLPGDFLTIILVMAMGILGATMQMTFDYHKANTVGGTSLFFLRPMLGAITALVVFILLKAGVIVVSDPARIADGAPLNPFFIAFVGVISGLLSDSAMETVRGIGGSWLKGSSSDPEARWASGVAAHIDGTVKTTTDLAAKTGLSEAEIKEWVEQKKLTPPSMQKLFAAWLDKPVQQLFTDIPPSA